MTDESYTLIIYDLQTAIRHNKALHCRTSHLYKRMVELTNMKLEIETRT